MTWLQDIRKLLNEFATNNNIRLAKNATRRRLIDFALKNNVELPPEPKRKLTLKRVNDDKYDKDEFDPIEQTEDFAERSKKVLNPHQKEFANSFVNSAERGALALHGLGSGKTLTSISTMNYYLDLYPDHNVTVITPSSNLIGFIEELDAYGHDIKDPRIKYYTYEGYRRQKKECKNDLMIIDEAHNLRSTITADIEKVDREGNVKTIESKQIPKIVLENCAKHAHKVLLLSGTPFINGVRDIENLMAFIDGRNPDYSGLAKMFNENEQIKIDEYFGCKISIFEAGKDFKKKFFPTKTEHEIYLKMSSDFEDKYDKIKNNELPDDVTLSRKKKGEDEDEPEKNLSSFYNGVRRAVNAISGRKNPKIKWIIDKVKNNPESKFIIYSSFLDSGINLIVSALKKIDVVPKLITGSSTQATKQSAQRLYNEGKIKIVIISRSGAEGLNFFETNFLIMLEPSWNRALEEQIIGRAVRFRSHEKLPEDKRHVDVYRLFMIRKKEQNITVEKIIKDIDDKKPVPSSLSIDLLMFAMAQTKVRDIRIAFNRIKKSDSLEKCSIVLYNKINSEIIKKQKEQDKVLSLKERLEIRKKHLDKIIKKVSKEIRTNNDSLLLKKIRLVTKDFKFDVKDLNQLFTPMEFSDELVKLAKIEKKENIHILEPTAGVGNLIESIIRLHPYVNNIDAVEFDEKNRKFLLNVSNDLPMLSISDYRDFMQFNTSQRYDYVIMNPPFNIKVNGKNFIDIDFIKHAYNFLNENGTLVAITSTSWIHNSKNPYKSAREWVNEKGGTFYEKVVKWKDNTIAKKMERQNLKIAFLTLHK